MHLSAISFSLELAMSLQTAEVLATCCNYKINFAQAPWSTGRLVLGSMLNSYKESDCLNIVKRPVV